MQVMMWSMVSFTLIVVCVDLKSLFRPCSELEMMHCMGLFTFVCSLYMYNAIYLDIIIATREKLHQIEQTLLRNLLA